MRTDTEVKLADLALKQQQLRWEPLKIVIASMGAGAALFAAGVVFMAAILRHYP